MPMRLDRAISHHTMCMPRRITGSSPVMTVSGHGPGFSPSPALMLAPLGSCPGMTGYGPGDTGPGFAFIAVEIIAREDTGMTEPHFMTIAEASAAIRAKTLSPVELTQSFLSRIKALDGQLDSFLVVLEETALAAAQAAAASRCTSSVTRRTRREDSDLFRPALRR